jgi:uncharacterized protein
MIDCDVHNVVSSINDLEPYLDRHWREVIATSQFAGPTDKAHPPNLATSVRPDLVSVDQKPPGATLESVQQQLLDPLGLSHALLSCDYGVESVRNPDAADALARATNDWQVAEWLERDPRVRAAIVVPSGQPEMARRELERASEHPGFVALYLPVRSAIPYGNRAWWPLLEAAAERELVVELHFGGSSGLPPTGAGWPTSWLEEYVDMASAFQSQLTSLIAEGTFDRFPTLRLALIESGFAWLPGFLWRFDKGWRGLRREIPWTRQAPSAYVRERVRVALQPVDGPTDAPSLVHVIDQLQSDELLMFSSDYPHAHSDEGLDAVPAGLPDEIREKLMDGNARSHYRL